MQSKVGDMTRWLDASPAVVLLLALPGDMVMAALLCTLLLVMAVSG